MKKTFTLFVFMLLFSFTGWSQAYMDEIAKKCCDCAAKVNPDLKENEFVMAIGVCMIEVAMPYRKKLKKDFGVDMTRIDLEGEKLGTVIGAHMVAFCPDLLMRLAGEVNDENAVEEQSAVLSAKGIVTKVEKDFLVVFHIKDETGKTIKCYWMAEIDSDLDLVMEYESLSGKKVEVHYVEEKLFDPRISEYRPHFVLTGLYRAD